MTMRAKHPERAGRLREFFKHLNISNKEASSKLGYGRPAYVSQLLNHHSTVTASVAYRLASVYPMLNPKWLLDGEGEMLTDEIPKADTLREAGVEYNKKPGDPLSALRALLEDHDRRIRALEEEVADLKKGKG